MHMPHIVCCLTRPEIQQSLFGCGGAVRITLLHDRSDVCAQVSRSAADAVLAEIIDSRGSTLSAALLHSWKTTIDVPVIAVARAVPDEIRLIADAVRVGVDEIAILGIDNVWERVAEALRKRSVARRHSIHNVIRHDTGDPTDTLLEACLREASQGNAKGLAHALGLSERTLTRRFAIAGIPSPGTVLRWMRVLLTLDDLQRPEESVAHAAKLRGYSSSIVFRAALRQLTGMRPRDARTPDGYRRALTAFELRLRHGDGDRSGRIDGARPRRATASA
jgi:AraC-like DNA-binding protein